MTAELALIGAGAMGGAIGARFRATGHLLWVFDLDSARVATLTAQGAVAAGSAAEAARQAQAVILSLNSARIVEAAVFGPAGVAEGAAAWYWPPSPRTSPIWARRARGRRPSSSTRCSAG